MAPAAVRSCGRPAGHGSSFTGARVWALPQEVGCTTAAVTLHRLTGCPVGGIALALRAGIGLVGRWNRGGLLEAHLLIHKMPLSLPVPKSGLLPKALALAAALPTLPTNEPLRLARETPPLLLGSLVGRPEQTSCPLLIHVEVDGHVCGIR
eukprot:16451719-Heterocapsa_arctica.AAC.1